MAFHGQRVGANLMLFPEIVTRSCLGGVCNERAAFGYNRDGKKGQRQIIIGLLCNARVQPLSIEVFAGHTQDTATMANQISKVVDRCGRSDSRIGGAVTWGRYSDSQTGRPAKARRLLCPPDRSDPSPAQRARCHAGYKDRALVKWVFRTSKSKIRYGGTMQLQMRPVQARLASRTRGHAVVIMRSYKIVQVAEGGDSTRRELAQRWRDLDATVQEGLDELKSGSRYGDTLCTTQLLVRGQPYGHCIPLPRTSVQKLWAKAWGVSRRQSVGRPRR